MVRTLAELTVEEFQEVLERTIDKRFEVWLTQALDAFEGPSGESGNEFSTEFAASVRRSLEESRAAEGIVLKTLRNGLGQ